MNAVATSYAKALFSLALENKKDHEIFEETKIIAECIIKNEGIIKIFSNKEISINQKKEIVTEIFGDKLNKETYNFLKLLVDKRRMNYVVDMCYEFQKMYYEYHNIKEAKVYSTHQITTKQLDDIKIVLENKYQSKFVVENFIDESLIGGIKIVINDLVIDGSIINKLSRLKSSIAHK
ncbi:MAG: ATP synthase F1 subunit delta [Bacilli bacterium]|jgi:F-type H+-transporting ATPase subunit delta|nr:ATP synthase F1 subunit delta [Bacilli bacterium]